MGMEMQLTKYNLFKFLTEPLGSTPEYITINGYTGYILAISREDGSGHCFNVSLSLKRGGYKQIFVRTID